jgi:hypothetical protein
VYQFPFVSTYKDTISNAEVTLNQRRDFEMTVDEILGQLYLWFIIQKFKGEAEENKKYSSLTR